MSLYRRKPDPVRAVQITDPPMTVWSEHPWDYLIADKRITFGPDGGPFVTTGTFATHAAYPGQWVVWHAQADVLEVLDDATFHQRYEEDHAA